MTFTMGLACIYVLLTIYQGTTSVEPTTSGAATTSVEPTTSGAATTSVEPTTSVAATTSVEPTTSGAATISGEPTTSGAATKSAAATTSVEPTTSVTTTTSVEPTTSVAATSSVEPSTSVARTTSAKPTTSVTTTTSVEPTTSVAATTSAAATTSVKATTLVVPTASTERTTPVVASTSVQRNMLAVSSTFSKEAITSLLRTSSIGLTTRAVTSTTPIATLPPAETLTVDVTMNTTYPFSDELLDSSTAEYKRLTLRIEFQCENRFRRFLLFVRCFVRGYRRGSTLVDLTVIFRKESNATGSFVEQKLKEGNNTAEWGFEINSVNTTVRTTPEPMQTPREFEVWKIVLIVCGVLCFIFIIILLSCLIKRKAGKGCYVSSKQKYKDKIMDYEESIPMRGKLYFKRPEANYLYPTDGKKRSTVEYPNNAYEDVLVVKGNGAVYDNPNPVETTRENYASLDLYDNFQHDK